MMRTIHLQTELEDGPLDEVGGHFMDSSYYDTLIGEESTQVIKPNGKPLLIYIKDCIPRNVCETAFKVLKKVDVIGSGDNRGLAAGIISDENDDKINRTHGSFGKLSGRGARYHTLKKDGTISRTTYSGAVNSGIIGYMDRYPRIPYCRQTAFNMDNPTLWQELLPYIEIVSQVYKEYAPEHYEAQRKFVGQIHPDFFIANSIFTTLTVNRNFRTALHKDKGDFNNGLGCMSVLQGGNYEGGNLVFPKYRSAVNMRTGSICLADVHEWHGNTELIGTPGHYIRISCVFYCREKMVHCGSTVFERERAKKFGTDVSQRHSDEGAQEKLF
jgi:hypothetical protein